MVHVDNEQLIMDLEKSRDGQQLSISLRSVFADMRVLATGRHGGPTHCGHGVPAQSD